MHQHRTGINKLLNIKLLQPAQQMARALDVHAAVKRVVSVGEIKIGDQVKHAG